MTLDELREQLLASPQRCVRAAQRWHEAAYLGGTMSKLLPEISG